MSETEEPALRTSSGAERGPKPWRYIAGAIVVAGILVSGTIVWATLRKGPDCSQWDRTVDRAAQALGQRWVNALAPALQGTADSQGQLEQLRAGTERGLRIAAQQEGRVPNTLDGEVLESFKTAVLGLGEDHPPDPSSVDDLGPFVVRPDGC